MGLQFALRKYNQFNQTLREHIFVFQDGVVNRQMAKQYDPGQSLEKGFDILEVPDQK